MNVAIISLTKNGFSLAKKLQPQFDGSIIYAKNNRTSKVDNENIILFDKLKAEMDYIFHHFDALIFFTSTGIAVRMIAPYIIHKAKDPAVLVADEQGKVVISLLSGHLGGGNEITLKVAEILKAQPIITTATDTQGKVAPDNIARELNLITYPHEHIKKINGALVNNEEIAYYIDQEFQDKASIKKTLMEKFQINARIIAYEDFLKEKGFKVFFTPRRVKVTNTLCITPKKYILGIGCRKDVDYIYIEKAVNEAKKMANLVEANVKIITSTIHKEKEQNLLLYGKNNKLEMYFYDNDTLNKVADEFHLDKSSFVKAQIGVGNVCEASILAYNKKAKIILHKTKFEKVTVAIGWE